MLRLSSYFILSDRLQNGGYALLNGLSGAIELINEDLYRAFKQMTLGGDPRELFIEESSFPESMVEAYLKRGHMTRLGHAEERQLLEALAAAMHERESANPAVVIIPDLDCNYRCVYCYEKPLQKKLKAGKTKMSVEEAGAAFKSIDRLASETGRKTDNISLFGGEPLLAANKGLVSYIVEEGVTRGISFSAVTNGHDLCEYMSLLGSGKIGSVQITIDGPAAIHNARRISLDGESSFERIISGMRRAVAETDVAISVRVNLDSENYPHFTDLIEVFGREDWLNNDRISINAAIVYEKDAGGAPFPSHDINRIRAELIETVGSYSNVEIGCPQSHKINSIFSSLVSDKPYILKSSFCGANCGMYAFLPGGKVSCCWESVGEEYGNIGTYSENGMELDERKAQRMFGRSAAKIPQCADCKYCLVCSGGCAQYAEFTHKDIYKPYCGDFPDTFGWVLADAVENFLKCNGL